ncbi:carbohydrate kinase family protein [Streptomyces sp. Go-475]|uniref:carbohydrate kinase family protein n=1 Tax=Streptomyces sp. Go-475 TaxID=2072505 RepID=UPI000DEF651A|nr:carbohydrate kinase family protein [Streptomyces sp. Go-475]AXE89711.1 Adenosine kinase [Streptomyces sp. Go-475]
MRIAVTGSIATDHLMTYPGRFADQLIPDRLDHVSLSFLADELQVRYGGVAANIALGLARLGLRPVLVGAVGRDFGEYDAWLRGNGVDTGSVHVSDTLHTARFVCTTDLDLNQIATFYAGAMAEAGRVRLASVRERAGELGLAVVAPNDPQAMLSLAAECRELGIPFAADPSQQLARLDGPQTRRLTEGSRLLFTNEYEAALLQERTGWTREQVLERTGAWIVTRGAAGADIGRPGEPWLHVDAVPANTVADPTGVGDAFRAGFLAALARGLPYPDAGRLGCALAAVALQGVGPQTYKVTSADLLLTIEQTYGADAARAHAPHLAW